MVSFLELTEAIAGAVFLLSATCRISRTLNGASRRGSAAGSCNEDTFGWKKCISFWGEPNNLVTKQDYSWWHRTENREGSIENVLKYVFRKFSAHAATRHWYFVRLMKIALWWSSIPFWRIFLSVNFICCPPYRSFYFSKIPVSDNDELTYSDIEQKQLAGLRGPLIVSTTKLTPSLQFVQAQQQHSCCKSRHSSTGHRGKYSFLLTRREIIKSITLTGARRHQRRGGRYRQAINTSLMAISSGS